MVCENHGGLNWQDAVMNLYPTSYKYPGVTVFPCVTFNIRQSTEEFSQRSNFDSFTASHTPEYGSMGMFPSIASGLRGNQ